MREKMRDHLGGKKSDRFMLKQDRGGITDVEFLAQYLVLRYSHEKPKLTRWCDNVRIFESLMSQGIMEESQGTKISRSIRSCMSGLCKGTGSWAKDISLGMGWAVTQWLSLKSSMVFGQLSSKTTFC